MTIESSSKHVNVMILTTVYTAKSQPKVHLVHKRRTDIFYSIKIWFENPAQMPTNNTLLEQVFLSDADVCVKKGFQNSS